MDQRVSTIIDGVSGKALFTSHKYQGHIAKNYEKKREGSAKWLGEDLKVKEYLNRALRGTSILDIPCGTGRFFPYYRERQFKFIGMDISLDMLDQAQKKAAYDHQVELGDIFNIDTCNIFDVVVCIRFMNLIEADDLKLALAELQRVGRRIIFSFRMKHKDPTGNYRHAHPFSLIKKALLPGWKISRNEPVHERDYRMIEVING